MSDNLTQSEHVGPDAEGTFWTRFGWAVMSPKRLFDDVAGGAPWWQPWVWVSIINLVIAYLSIPIQRRLIELNPSDVPEEQLQQTLEALDKFAVLGLVTTPIVVLLTSVIIAGISYIAVNVMAESPSFKKYLTLYFYANIVLSLGLLLGTLVTRMRGVETIRSAQDAVATFGPAMLLGPGNKILYPVLSTLDVFSLWFYALIGMGVMHIFRTTSRAAFFVVIPLWLLFVLIALIGSRAGAMS